MARRGDGLYLRGTVWYLDCRINGTRYMVKLGKHIGRNDARDIAIVKRSGSPCIKPGASCRSV